MDLADYVYKGKNKFKLKNFSTDSAGGLISKEDAETEMKKNIEKMISLQDKLYADNHYALLLIFQAMDTGGKDSAIRNVMSGLNPQGCRIAVFKEPSAEELDHDYLWKAHKNLPQRGQIGIFNRSYYEEVLVVRVHNLLAKQNLPSGSIRDTVWEERFRQIKDFERYLYENAVIPLKFFLHISKDEQKVRLLKRIDDPSKNWKFSEADVKERHYWNEYQSCYEEAIRETATEDVPWYVIPSDKKWLSRLVISEIIVKTLSGLKLYYPELNKEQLISLEKNKKLLLDE